MKFIYKYIIIKFNITSSKCYIFSIEHRTYLRNIRYALKSSLRCPLQQQFQRQGEGHTANSAVHETEPTSVRYCYVGLSL